MEKKYKIGQNPNSRNGFKKGHRFYGDLTKENYFQTGFTPWNKGIMEATNTGRTHWKKGQFAREKNNNWKGGISFFNQLRRCKEDYKEWRLSVFKRDGFICQQCGGSGDKLHAHHFIHFAKLIGTKFAHHITNIDNGITLCIKCHKNVHNDFVRE